MKCGRGMLPFSTHSTWILRSCRRTVSTMPRTASHSFSIVRAVNRTSISSAEICSRTLMYSFERWPCFASATLSFSKRRWILPKRSSASSFSWSRLALIAALSSPSSSSSSSSSSSTSASAAISGGGSSFAFGSTRPSTSSSMRISSRFTLSARSRMSTIVVGSAEIAMIICLRPSSIRFAISISPSRVRSSTEPISRMYMRTGSVVRPNSGSTVASAASASSSASSSAAAAGAFSVMSSVSASGASSNTWMPMSLNVEIIVSICSASTTSGR